MKNQIIVAIILLFGLASCTRGQNRLSTSTMTAFPTVLSTLQATTQPTETQTVSKNVFLDFAVSWDETRLAVYSNTEVYIYNFSTQDKVVIKRFENGDYISNKAGSVAFNPDGTQIAISGKFAGEPIEIWDIQQQRLLKTLSDVPEKYWAAKIQFSPNGEKILARFSDISCEAGKESEKFALLSIDGDKDWENSDLFSLKLYCSYGYVIKTLFTNNDRLFIFTKNLTTPALIFDANTGQYISEILAPSGQLRFYYDVSLDGKIAVGSSLENYSYLVNTETMKEIKVDGIVLLLNNENSFVASDINSHWYLSENGKAKCSYTGIFGSLIYTELSASKNLVIKFLNDGKGVQIWDVSNCEMVYALTIE